MGVILRTEGIHLEDVGASSVVVRVQADEDPVVLVEPSSAMEDVRQDPLRLGVEHDHGEVDRPAVVGDPDLCSLRGWCTIHRPPLSEACDGLDLLPDRLVQHAVYLRRFGNPNRPHGEILPASIPFGSVVGARLPPGCRAHGESDEENE